MESPGTLFSTSIEERPPKKPLPLPLPTDAPSLRVMNFLQIRRQMVICGLDASPPK